MVKQSARTFGSALIDFSFHSFVTPTIVQIVYVLAILLAGIQSLLVFYLCTSFRSLIPGAYGGYGGGESGGSFILGVILSPIVFVVQIVVARVILECAVALIRVAENTDALQRRETLDRSRPS